ncbi:MFS transporter [Campylobacter sp. MG1]|uniref:MFS transporter n=1 Tax=Campylobacter sp. MG1 TaxID=2976332 RepID=UPI00226CDDF3|nr:MFS transporter [Campylobacter sp. MG1]
MRELNNKDIKTLSLSALGSILEFYDFIIFAIFTPYFTDAFLPSYLDESIKYIYTYGAFAAGYLARPLGGIVMAHFGDKFGRKNMFLLSIILMVIPTFIFAIMPTYEQIGYLAIVILLLIRISQGIAMGGEMPGAWVFIYEHSPSHSKGLFLGLLTCGVCGGIVLGTFIALNLQIIYTEEQIKEYAYRIPFLLGGIFGLISVYLRKFLSETPTFLKLKESKELHSFPLKSVIKDYKKDILLSMCLTLVLTACVVIMLLLIPNYAKKTLNLAPITSTCLQMAGALMVIFGLICTGTLADFFKPSNVCKIFSLGLIIFCPMYFYELYVGKDLVLLSAFYLLACFFIGVVNFASIFMCNLFRPNVLFSGISFSYNIAYAIAGFLTPILLVKLHDIAVNTNTIGAGYYMIFIGILSYFCAIMYEKIKNHRK